ncbi:hypothetical protein M885DRAFT_571787 [Pelagophyceae sp. CCMP2097]|nr:hypothetical protein M885DRAFT_571787 [Pelagophyceae sp. CCMP2097]
MAMKAAGIRERVPGGKRVAEPRGTAGGFPVPARGPSAFARGAAARAAPTEAGAAPRAPTPAGRREAVAAAAAAPPARRAAGPPAFCAEDDGAAAPAADGGAFASAFADNDATLAGMSQEEIEDAVDEVRGSIGGDTFEWLKKRAAAKRPQTAASDRAPKCEPQSAPEPEWMAARATGGKAAALAAGLASDSDAARRYALATISSYIGSDEAAPDLSAARSELLAAVLKFTAAPRSGRYRREEQAHACAALAKLAATPEFDAQALAPAASSLGWLLVAMRDDALRGDALLIAARAAAVSEAACETFVREDAVGVAMGLDEARGHGFVVALCAASRAATRDALLRGTAHALLARGDAAAAASVARCALAPETPGRAARRRVGPDATEAAQAVEVVELVVAALRPAAGGALSTTVLADLCVALRAPGGAVRRAGAAAVGEALCARLDACRAALFWAVSDARAPPCAPHLVAQLLATLLETPPADGGHLTPPRGAAGNFEARVAATARALAAAALPALARDALSATEWDLASAVYRVVSALARNKGPRWPAGGEVDDVAKLCARACRAARARLGRGESPFAAADATGAADAVPRAAEPALGLVLLCGGCEARTPLDDSPALFALLACTAPHHVGFAEALHDAALRKQLLSQLKHADVSLPPPPSWPFALLAAPGAPPAAVCAALSRLDAWEAAATPYVRAVPASVKFAHVAYASLAVSDGAAASAALARLASAYTATGMDASLGAAVRRIRSEAGGGESGCGDEAGDPAEAFAGDLCSRVIAETHADARACAVLAHVLAATFPAAARRVVWRELGRPSLMHLLDDFLPYEACLPADVADADVLYADVAAALRAPTLRRRPASPTYRLAVETVAAALRGDSPFVRRCRLDDLRRHADAAVVLDVEAAATH